MPCRSFNLLYYISVLYEVFVYRTFIYLSKFYCIFYHVIINTFDHGSQMKRYDIYKHDQATRKINCFNCFCFAFSLSIILRKEQTQFQLRIFMFFHLSLLTF